MNGRTHYLIADRHSSLGYGYASKWRKRREWDDILSLIVNIDGSNGDADNAAVAFVVAQWSEMLKNEKIDESNSQSDEVFYRPSEVSAANFLYLCK